MSSANGKGRTLFEILTGRNKRDMRPLELQYHNPLDAKVGQTISVDHDPQTLGINFVIERMSVYKTTIKGAAYYHTDYHLKGVTLDRDTPLRLRLRLIPDKDVNNTLGHRIYLLNLYDERGWESTEEEVKAGWYGDKPFGEFLVEKVLNNGTGTFEVNQDDNGADLAEPRKYWRVEDAIDPYKARVTVLTDKDGDGKVEEKELDRFDVTYWDYHRETKDAITGQTFVELLTVEMKDKARYFTFLRGREVGAFQVMVI
jgi:hypothetical protein